MTEARGVRIRNATIGGKLEVFERVDYESLFRPVDGAGTMSLFPRVLILDMTCLGASSATGQIKKTLFTGWPEGRLARVEPASPSTRGRSWPRCCPRPREGSWMAVGAGAYDALAPFLTGGFTVHTLAPDATTAVGAGPRARPEPGPGSADHVATTTVRELIEQRRLSRLDLLIVDSPHLGILQDVAWAERRPRFVMCAFDGEETRQTGYTLHDLTRLLVAQGYRVWVSEWHPPTRFGSKFMKAGRRWRRLVPYPCHLGSPRAFGYCIATRETADAEALAEAARRAIERPSPTRSIPWLGLTVQRSVPKVYHGVTKVKRWARALTNRTRAGIVAYLDGHHPYASASLRAALGRLRAYRRVLDRLS